MFSATDRYPDLMAYITSRNALETARNWCSQLREDEHAARSGAFSEVASDLARAQADYGKYPYNRAMGEFLGLPLGDNGEPRHGYYMANGVSDHYAFGKALRTAVQLIDQRRVLRVVIARSRKTGEPVQSCYFRGSDQIKIDGNRVVASAGKRRVTLSSNWSFQTAMVHLATALQTGQPYGG